MTRSMRFFRSARPPWKSTTSSLAGSTYSAHRAADDIGAEARFAQHPAHLGGGWGEGVAREAVPFARHAVDLVREPENAPDEALDHSRAGILLAQRNHRPATPGCERGERFV